MATSNNNVALIVTGSLLGAFFLLASIFIVYIICCPRDSSKEPPVRRQNSPRASARAVNDVVVRVGDDIIPCVPPLSKISISRMNLGGATTEDTNTDGVESVSIISTSGTSSVAWKLAKTKGRDEEPHGSVSLLTCRTLSSVSKETVLSPQLTGTDTFNDEMFEESLLERMLSSQWRGVSTGRPLSTADQDSVERQRNQKAA